MGQETQGKESTALAVTLANDKALGQIFVDSGFFKDTTEQSQAIVKILAGREVGLQPIEAMTGIHIVKGKVTLGANLMAAAIKKSEKYNYKVINHTDKECVIDFFEGEEKLGTSTFTIEDAKRAGVYKPGGSWVMYPRNMLFARAMSNGSKWYCPDVFGYSPVYVPEEMGINVDGEGEPINVTPPKSTVAVSYKQCSQCGNSIPRDNESGLCANCTVANHEERPVVPPKAVQEVMDADHIDDPIVDERDEEILPEDDDTDTTTVSFPEDLINSDMKPREALDGILDYAMDKGLGDVVRPVIVKHYKKYDDLGQYAYHIPETKVIKIVEELTGIKTKKAEKDLTCKADGCKAKITEAEAKVQKNLCLKHWEEANQD